MPQSAPRRRSSAALVREKAAVRKHMWLYQTSGFGTAGKEEWPIVLYEFHPGCGKKHPEAYLKDFRGYLHTDGYAGYHKMSEEITVVGCCAHARGKFDKALKSLPKAKARSSAAYQGLNYCNHLFAIEQELADKLAAERYEERLKQAKSIQVAMFCV